MKLGIHAFAWCTEWSNKTLDLIDKVKGYGVDFIEIPMMDLPLYDVVAVRQRLSDNQLDAVTSTVLSADIDVSSPEESIREAGIRFLKQCVDATAETGLSSFSGVIYCEFARKDQHKPSSDNWKFAAESLRRVAEHAEPQGVSIGIEPVNRYESNLVNTAAQAIELKEMIDHPSIRIHLDTYHMNIEEKSFYDATKLAGKDLIHYHLCENDRGIPGTGLVDWDGIFQGLKEIEYTGYAGLESFVGLAQSMNTWVWRTLAPSGDELLDQGIRFIRSMQKKYAL